MGKENRGNQVRILYLIPGVKRSMERWNQSSLKEKFDMAFKDIFCC